MNIGLYIVSQPPMFLQMVISLLWEFRTLFLDRYQELQISKYSANQHLNYKMSLWFETTFLVSHIFEIQHLQAE